MFYLEIYQVLDITKTSARMQAIEREPQMEVLLLDKKQTAALLGVSARTVHSLIRLGRLKAKRIGRRVLVAREEVERFARRDHPERTDGKES